MPSKAMGHWMLIFSKKSKAGALVIGRGERPVAFGDCNKKRLTPLHKKYERAIYSDMCNLHLSVFVLVTEMFFKSFNYFKPSCRKLSGPRGM